ncbi:MAG: hypothetical protein ACKOEZ_07675, partial [Spartobacteria bacterium]
YSIHMVFALRQNGGDHQAALRDVGKALALCAATTVAGFGSLATAQTTGLASLGINCATGCKAPPVSPRGFSSFRDAERVAARLL